MAVIPAVSFFSGLAYLLCADLRHRPAVDYSLYNPDSCLVLSGIHPGNLRKSGLIPFPSAVCRSVIFRGRFLPRGDESSHKKEKYLCCHPSDIKMLFFLSIAPVHTAPYSGGRIPECPPRLRADYPAGSQRNSLRNS